MPIASSDIQVVGTPQLSYAGRQLAGSLAYTVLVESTGEVLEMGTVSEGGRSVMLVSAEQLRKRLIHKAARIRNEIRAWNAPNAVLGGYSLREALTWIAGWEITPPAKRGGMWSLMHPAADQEVMSKFVDGLDDERLPTIPAILGVLLSSCLPGPARCVAECAEAGKLTVGCSPVDGAVAYAWFTQRIGLVDGEAVSSAPVIMHTRTLNPTGSTKSAEAGRYRVWAAAVAADDTVGLLSEPVEVVVE